MTMYSPDRYATSLRNQSIFRPPTMPLVPQQQGAGMGDALGGLAKFGLGQWAKSHPEGEIAKMMAPSAAGGAGAMAGGPWSMLAGMAGKAIGGEKNGGALGGAASGAVTGAQIAGPWGALAGGIIGGLLG